MGRLKTFCWQYWVRVLRGGDFLGKKRLSTLIFRWLSTFSSKLFCYLLKALFGSLTVVALVFDPLSFQKKTNPAEHFQIKWGQVFAVSVFWRCYDGLLIRSSNFGPKWLLANLFQKINYEFCSLLSEDCLLIVQKANKHKTLQKNIHSCQKRQWISEYRRLWTVILYQSLKIWLALYIAWKKTLLICFPDWYMVYISA